MRLIKYGKNPILSPHPENPWENFVVCNPGAYYDNGTVYMLYRAAGNDKDHRIHFGLATSTDGYAFTRASDKPALSPSMEDGIDGGCIEDARIVKMGDWFFVTYAFRPFPPGQYWTKPGWAAETPYLNEAFLPKFTRQNLTMSGLALTRDFKKFIRAGVLTSPMDDNRDVILFPELVGGRYVMLHRPQQWVGPKQGCEKPSMWLAFGDDPLNWTEHHLLAQPQFDWEFKKIGGSTPPLKTERGWLVLYHGVDKDNTYRTGAMMLALEDPRKVIARAPDFILEPATEHETKGLTPFGVCFPTANVVINGTLFVYYGAGDKFISVATAPLKEVVGYVMQHPVK